MLRRLSSVCPLALSISLSVSIVHAQQIPYERILVPLPYSASLPGAFGSLWSTTLTAVNDSDADVRVTECPACLCVESCGERSPHESFDLQLSFPQGYSSAGAFVYVGNPAAGRVRFTLRVQDVSREALTWGTTVPVVRERDAFTGRLQLLDVPVDDRFRVALRVYDFDEPPASGSYDRAVRIRFYQGESRTALFETVSQFFPYRAGTAGYPIASPTLFIGNIVTEFPALGALPPDARVRIEMEPASAGLRYWAFASVTNNETQHVTVIAPAQ